MSLKVEELKKITEEANEILSEFYGVKDPDSGVLVDLVYTSILTSMIGTMRMEQNSYYPINKILLDVQEGVKETGMITLAVPNEMAKEILDCKKNKKNQELYQYITLSCKENT